MEKSFENNLYKMAKELTERLFDFLSELHARIWKVEDFQLQEQRYRTFKSKVLFYKNQGFEVEDFERYLDNYKMIRWIERNRKV